MTKQNMRNKSNKFFTENNILFTALSKKFAILLVHLYLKKMYWDIFKLNLNLPSGVLKLVNIIQKYIRLTYRKRFCNIFNKNLFA
jgi:hypothetical protein